MSEQSYGEWIEHDGSGCPIAGLRCEVFYEDNGPDPHPGRPAKDTASWHWYESFAYGGKLSNVDVTADPIIRYRLLRSDAVRDLIAIARDVREKVPA